MIPLNDLGAERYLGFVGGLYPGGKNTAPLAYAEAAAALGATVQPVDRDGSPSTKGRIGLLSIGMSNASHEFSEFIRLVETDSRKPASLFLVDAALEGMSASQIAHPQAKYWQHVDRQLEAAGTMPAQVQVIWLKLAEGYEKAGFPDHAQRLQSSIRATLEILKSKFPLLKLVYLSSRIYGGYSEIALSPEPIAYESGFAVKWLIEERIESATLRDQSPWVGWGPYLWANGNNPRSDGLIWEPSDFTADGVHPSPRGCLKVAARLLDFFQTDPTTRPWFLPQPP